MNDIAHNSHRSGTKSQRLQRVAAVLQKKLRCLQSVKQNLRAPSQKPLMPGSVNLVKTYVQEGVDKIRHFQELGVTGLEWHFIGPLQSNKAARWQSISTGVIPSTVCALLPASTISARQNFPS